MIVLEFEPSAAERVAAFAVMSGARSRPAPPSRVRPWHFLALFFALTAGLFAWLQFRDNPAAAGPPSQPAPAPEAGMTPLDYVSLAMKGGGMAVAAAGLATFWRAARTRRASDPLGPARHTIGEHGLRVEQPGRRAEYDWAAFRGVAESDALFVLYRSDTQWHVLPKRAFESPSQAAAFRALVADARVTQGGPRP